MYIGKIEKSHKREKQRERQRERETAIFHSNLDTLLQNLKHETADGILYFVKQ